MSVGHKDLADRPRFAMVPLLSALYRRYEQECDRSRVLQTDVALVNWRDGKVVEVAPDSVELPSDGDEADSQQRPRSHRYP